MNDKTKSIFAIMAIILTLSGLYLFRGIRLYRDTMDKNIAKTMENTLFLMDETVKNSRLMYDMRLNVLIRDEKIQAAFAGRNRDELYLLTLPFHDAYKAENLFYTNLHFHLPSGHSFLRMHEPEEFGDDLSVIRPMIMQVHKIQNPLSGYEIGKHGLFYRVVRPMFFKGEYVGAVELGIMAEEVVDRIETALKIKIARVVKDENLNKPFQERSKNEIHTQGFSIHPYKHESFFNQVAGAYDFTRESVQQIQVDGRSMAVFTFGNLESYEGGAIAWFLIAQDISGEITGYRSFLSRSIYLTLVLVILAYAVLYFSFGSYINRITELNKTLESRVKERTQELEAVTDKLMLTHAELDQIFNTAADGMRLIGIDFKILRVNETFSKLIGTDKQLAVNTLCHEHFKGRFCFSPECTLKRILNGEEYIEIDVEKETASGEKRSFLLTATPFKSANGEILGVVENFKDITHRKNAARAIEENEHYLRAIMSTVQAGVIITDEKSPLIIDANPYALKLIGCSREELMKSSIRDHFSLEKPWIDHVLKSESPFEKEDYILTTASGKKRNIRLSVARATHKGRTYLVQSFSDMTDIKRFVEQQAVDIHKAKSILNLVNPSPPRYMTLPGGRRLFADIICVPCHAEGGDHLLIRHFPNHTAPKTVISLKDQSGHEVNCILRSIYTDLLHNALLFNCRESTLDQVMTKLNQELCRSGFFKADDFFSSITAEIDHHSLMLRYITAGHPPFILIRNNKALSMPRPGEEKNHLPIPFLKNASYGSTCFQLQENDQLLFYTDGLTEMTLRNLKTAMTADELRLHVQALIDDFHRATGRTMPVSALTAALLERISAMSGETVLPEQGNSKPVNTSSDDITLAGIEIETLHQSITKIVYPKTAADVSGFVQEILTLVFDQKENTAYRHMKSRAFMILEEALINAWKHGNHMNPDKPVTLCFDSRNDFVFEITDQGPGFDYCNLPDPTSAENIQKDSGRGLFILRHFSDHVEWKGTGNHILISLKKMKSLDNRADMENPATCIGIWGKN